MASDHEDYLTYILDMGRYRSMSIVVDFDSSSPPAEGEAALQQSFDYQQVFEALAHSQEVATNVFARCAKRHFRKIVVDALLKTSAEFSKRPLWLLAASVTIDLPKAEDMADHAEALSALLKELVDEFGQSVERMRKDRSNLVLVDALTSHLLSVGPATIKFEVKQRWGFAE